MRSAIDRPVFIVGCGRSGTTLVYELVAGHRETAWFSNYTSRWQRATPLAAFNGLSRLARVRGVDHAAVPRPSEAYPIWDRIHPLPAAGYTGPLTGTQATPAERALAHRIVLAHLRWARAQRFVNKNTRNVTRIRYLNAIFPDALFIHVLRDPRAAVSSLLDVGFWPQLKVWCYDGMTPAEWTGQGGDEVEMAAVLWSREIEIALEHKEHVPATRYHEVRYERLVAHPKDAIAEVLDFCQLPWDRRFTELFDTFAMRDGNTGFRSRLTDADVNTVTERTGALASKLGYSL